MQSANKAPGTTFGKRSEPHRIIISRGDEVRSFTVKPWLAGLVLIAVFLVVAGYLGATGYLVFRDRLIASANTTQSDIRAAYEDRIASLRAQNDRITSRQLIDRRNYEEKLKQLLARQNDLDQRQDRIKAVIDLAARSGLNLALAPIPAAKPEVAELKIDGSGAAKALGGESILLSNGTGPLGLRGSMASDFADAEPDYVPVAEPQPPEDGLAVMDKVSLDLGRMKDQTSAVLDAIAVSAQKRIARIESITAPLGIDLPDGDHSVGGPFVPLVAEGFDARVERAERSIARLGSLREAIKALPLGKPVPRASLSSHFGRRIDPFLGRPAMHTGLDFKADYGTAVRATAAGTVISAGRNGGYGLMVEIDHGNGIVTRYAHLSRIRIDEGTKVAAGKIIGSVGSSGRSTGPHLHYETRLDGAPRDPASFLAAGARLEASLQ